MNKYNIFPLILLIIFLIFCFIFKPNNNDNNIEQYTKTIDSSQLIIDSLKGEIVKVDKIIDSLNTELVILDSANIVLKHKIVIIKQKSNEKVNNVDKLNISELNKFFTDRYK